MSRFHVTLLSLILLIFSFFSFFRIQNQGLLIHDAGAYLLEAKFLDEGFEILKGLRSSESRNPEFWEEVKGKTRGAPLHSGKPGFNLILWGSGKILGFSDSLSARVAGLFAVFSLILTFLIACQLSSPLSGIYATAFLASSVFNLMYARSGLAEQVVTAFFLSGLFLILRSWKKSSHFILYGAGLCLGFTFTCNPWRVLYLLALVLAFDFLALWLKKKWNWKTGFKRTSFILIGYFTPILLFEVPYLLLKFEFRALPFKDYWIYLYEKLTWVGGVVWFERPWDLAKEYWLVEGPFFVFSLLAAWGFLLIRLLFKKRFEDLFLLAFSLLPFVYFSFATPHAETLPRVVSNILPIASLVVGEFVFFLQKRLQQKLIPLTIIIILAQALPRQVRLVRIRSGYREASDFLKTTGKNQFMILGMEPVWRFYLGRVAYEPYNRPQSLEELVQKARARKIEHLLVDFSTIHSKYGCRYTASLIGKQTPVATFSNPLGSDGFAYLLDQYGLQGSREISEDPLSRKIYVFSISSIEGPNKEPA